MIMARELAFADDPRTLDILSDTTVLIVPSINGDGRAANTRGNSTGQDLNRDYSLIREPETFAFVEMMRDYKPEAAFDGHEFGNNSAGDLPVLPPRHLNVAQSIHDQSKSMIEDWMYGHGSADGWWYCPYGCQGGGAVGLSQETILRNTMGLKSVVGSLLEARSAGGTTRPNEGNAPNNRRRKSYSAIYTYQQFLDYQLANRSEIEEAIEESIAFQTSNTGRIVFRGCIPSRLSRRRIRARARRRTRIQRRSRSSIHRRAATCSAKCSGRNRSRMGGRSATASSPTASTRPTASGATTTGSRWTSRSAG